MPDFTPLDSASAQVLEGLLDEIATLRTRQAALQEQLEAWAGRPDALRLAEYAVLGLPAEVTQWFIQADALQSGQQTLAQRHAELQVSPVNLLSERLEQASAAMEEELRGLRALLPMSRQVMQARAQLRETQAKLGTQGFGKLWGTLTGRQSALQKEQAWVEKQLQRMQREFSDLQQQHSVNLAAEDVQPHFEQRLREWNGALATLQEELVAQRQQHEAALQQLAADEQHWQTAQQAQLSTWESFALPPLSEWLSLWEKKDQGAQLWQAYQAVTSSLQATQHELEEQWRTWPPDERHEQAARERLLAWQQRPSEVVTGPAPLLPWVGQAVTFEIAASPVILTSEPGAAPPPLLPWLEAKTFRAVRAAELPDQAPLPQPLMAEVTEPAALSEVEEFEVLPVVLADVELQAERSLTAESQPIEVPEWPLTGVTVAPLLPEAAVEPLFPEPLPQPAQLWPVPPMPVIPDSALPLAPFLPGSSAPVDTVEPEPAVTLPWLGTLPDQLNLVSGTAELFEQAARAAITPEERTRQIAVKVAVATGRQHQVNFIEDRLAGGFSALKAPRLQRQLSTLSEAEIVLVEELYAWWPEQTHYGAAYRMRNGEWQRASANISRQTCEQLVGRYSSTPSFEEITQLLEDLHEHLGYSRIAFAYQIQTILDELPDDMDFETWVNWMTAVAPLQDGEDWADEIDFQNLMRHL